MAQDFPRTEQGLQDALAARKEAREAGDFAAEAHLLLEIGYLVKWVRSDNREDPFTRSHSLAMGALAIFRRIDDRLGQIRALINAVPLQPREVAEQFLDEAESLAREMGEELQIAHVLAARARNLALYDRHKAKRVCLEALATYRQLEQTRGMAGCLFSLAIGEGDDKEKRGYAFEAIECMRTSGDVSEVAKCLSIAAMNSKPAELIDLEPEFLRALDEAQTAGRISDEGLCYSYLARIASAKGDKNAAAKFQRWAAEVEASDGLSPEERRKEMAAFAKQMARTAKAIGAEEAAKVFDDDDS